MRRFLTAAAAASAVLGAGVAFAATTPPALKAVLHRIHCHRALDPLGRYVSVTAVMRPLPGTEHLAVRFRLLERAAGASSQTALTGPGLGDWLTPDDRTLGQRPNDVWKVVKPVADLAAPAAYQFAVDFRWIGSRGHVIASETRLTRRCLQPELRPDLVVRRIDVSPDPANAGMDDYLVTLDNTGATGAGPFAVAFTDAGVEDDQTVDRLDAHSSVSLTFAGGACMPSQPPKVTADPQGQVDVWTRAQATLVATCPSAS